MGWQEEEEERECFSINRIAVPEGKIGIVGWWVGIGLNMDAGMAGGGWLR